MKKMVSLLLALALALTLCACVTPKTPMPIEDGDKSAAQPVTVRLGGLKGPTSMGMVKLLDDAESGATENGYAFTMAASANELTPQLVQGELDIVAVPANVAAILYNQTEGGVELLAAGTLGVLYMVEKGGETVTDVASLSGKTIYATGKGATPEYALTYLLSQHGLTLGTDVQVEWKSEPTEIVALMAEQENAVALINKTDLGSAVEPGELPFLNVIPICAKTGAGLDQLADAVDTMFENETPCDGSILTNARQFDAIRRAYEAMLRALQGLQLGVTPDAVLTDVEQAMEAMGEITGATVREDITARIFERFCVGK